MKGLYSGILYGIRRWRQVSVIRLLQFKVRVDCSYTNRGVYKGKVKVKGLGFRG